MYDYLIGIDCGGAGTRARIEHADGTPVGYGTGRRRRRRAAVRAHAVGHAEHFARGGQEGDRYPVRTRHEWLSRETGIAASEEILALGLSPNAPVARLKRLRTADNVVMAIESTTIPAQYLPNPRTITDSLYGYLEAHNLVPVRALQHIRAVNATVEQARLANIKQGAAMLYITRVGYLEPAITSCLASSICMCTAAAET
jgi:DNA-binding GntR family transcriptional regulator